MHSALSPSMWMENLNLQVPAIELDSSKIASMDTKVLSCFNPFMDGTIKYSHPVNGAELKVSFILHR